MQQSTFVTGAAFSKYLILAPYSDNLMLRWK